VLPCGASVTSCCVRWPESVRCSRVPCWPSCPNWACSIASRSPHWPVWRPSAATVAAYRGSRCIWGGRAQVRRVLYMATVAGVRSNPAVRTFYLRLRADGKHAKPALTACMRKFLGCSQCHASQQNALADTRAHLINLSPLSPPGRGFRTRLLPGQPAAPRCSGFLKWSLSQALLTCEFTPDTELARLAPIS